MSAPGKGSALADIAADLGTGAALLPVSPGGDGEQGDLLAFERELDALDGATIGAPRRRGRPAGSPNRSTLDLKRLLLARGYRDPAEFLASVMSMDVIELAKALRGGADGLQPSFDQAQAALALQVRAASELMPYFHQKMPIAVQHSGETARPLIVIAGGAATIQERQAGDGALSVHSLVDQTLSGDGGASSHDRPSHDHNQVVDGTAKTND